MLVVYLTLGAQTHISERQSQAGTNLSARVLLQLLLDDFVEQVLSKEKCVFYIRQTARHVPMYILLSYI